jgi:hypothetical protein
MIKLYIKQEGEYLEVLPTDLYAEVVGLKSESLKRMRMAKTGKHRYIKLGKHYFYIVDSKTTAL